MPYLYRMEATMVSRASGKSAVSFAAYIDRTSYKNERTGITTKDFRDEGPLEWSKVWTPEVAPAWMRDHEKLWNELERREDQQNRREQALLLRSWIIAIPHWDGQTKEDRVLITKDIMREFTRHGWVAHAAIHAPDADSPNYHIHIGNPMRFITENGFGKRREACTDGRFETKRDELNWWRAKWAEIGTRHLERAGFHLEAERFKQGHKTLDKQRDEAIKRGDHQWAKECDREPQIHMGSAAMAMENRGIPTRKGDINREIEARNSERRETHKIDELLKNLPSGWQMPNQVERHGIPVWWALESSKTPQEFMESVKKEGWQIARVDKDDATASRSRRMAAERLMGDYQPVFREGDYVAVNGRGRAFYLNEKTTGRSFQEMKQFMEPLDKEFVNSLRAAENFASFRKEINGRPTSRAGRNIVARRTTIAALRKTARATGAILDLATTGAKLLGNIIDPSLTPEQKVAMDLNTTRKRLAGEHSQARRRVEDEHSQGAGRER